ncbi:MAG TPA: PAS domain-containing protein [Burkholderiales bacterium]|nr:PAS domain-containing protein [Burkholderiales bacterium]
MAVPNKLQKQVPAPALYRLLSDSALARAALGACGFPIAMLDAGAAARPVTYVNAAFEKFFGYAADDALEQPLAALVFRGDEPLVHRMLAEPNSRWKLRAWGKDDALRYVEVSLGAVRNGEDELTHWVVAFSDRAEVEQLRSELEGLRSLAAGP